jgi:hypothetical protein
VYLKNEGGKMVQRTLDGDDLKDVLAIACPPEEEKK